MAGFFDAIPVRPGISLGVRPPILFRNFIYCSLNSDPAEKLPILSDILKYFFRTQKCLEVIS
jgi:hypothetical protein